MEAAVRCGADAVYLGRRCSTPGAMPPTLTIFPWRETVKYCHERDVRVHLTLNTLMYDSEISQGGAGDRTGLPRRCGRGDRAGYGGGFAAAADLPPAAAARLHPDGGTQSGRRTADAADGLSAGGAGREMSREEIARVVNGCDIETEIFVHGALCMCVVRTVLSQLDDRGAQRKPGALRPALPFAPQGGSARKTSGGQLLPFPEGSEPDRADGGAQRFGDHVAENRGADEAPRICGSGGFRLRAGPGRRDFGYQPAAGGVFPEAALPTDILPGSWAGRCLASGKRRMWSPPRGCWGSWRRCTERKAQRVPVAFRFTLRPDVPAQLRCEDHRGNAGYGFRGSSPESDQPPHPTLRRWRKALPRPVPPLFPGEHPPAILPRGLMLPVSALNALRREALEQLGERRGMLHHYQIQQPPEPVDVFPKHLDFPLSRAAGRVFTR